MTQNLLLSFLLLTGTVLAASDNGKILKLKKTSVAVHIDGVIDSVWSTADSVSDFVQFQPYHNAEPTQRTVAKVLTTGEALYCLVICYGKKDRIQQNSGKLDDFGGDVVSIMLDTFGDNRTAYKFAVSATGVRGDSRLLDDARDRDYSWDGIWFADGKVYEWGYVVEMEIPYKSIQYDVDLNKWGLDFDRWIPAATEDIYWCPYEENEGQRVSKFGRLVFEDFTPTVRGLNLEIYPVGISKVTFLRTNVYSLDPNAGIDIFYNPSPVLKFQLTANPDFAQIEADPYEFNISRYETYFSERRPFFTEGNEVFLASGRQRNTGFYRPLELFYSRRIGKKLPDGTEVPLLMGTKAFGRVNDWEYGGFLALTGETDYTADGMRQTEPRATFGSVRFKKQIFDNSSVGVLFVGKHTQANDYGVLDIDGAFRTASWQLAYQLARSFENGAGGYAGSAGFTQFTESWLTLMRGRVVQDDFNVSQVGFVPWRGTAQFVGITGPRWYFQEGYIKQVLLYLGPVLSYEKIDHFTDYGAVFGYNMQFRSNWGFEINVSRTKSKDLEKIFNSSEWNFSSWFHTSPKWNGNVWGGYARTYNFSRDYLAFYSWMGSSFSWQAADILEVGTSANMFIEGNPSGSIEDITYNARPYFSATPVNDLNLRVYVDNLFVRSTKQVQQLIFGFLFAYNFSPKSWIYFALNDVQDRSERYDARGFLLPNELHTVSRAGVFKIKYLYYF